MNKIQALEQEIIGFETRESDLTAELGRLKAQLSMRNSQLQMVILKGGDTREFEFEIAGLNTQISGIQTTLENLPAILQSKRSILDAEKKKQELFLENSKTIFSEFDQKNKIIVEKINELSQALTDQKAIGKKFMAMAQQTGNENYAQAGQIRVANERNSTLQKTLSKMIPSFKAIREM